VTCPARHYVYSWPDGVYLQARMEKNAECMLVIIGAHQKGRKETDRLQVAFEKRTSWHD